MIVLNSVLWFLYNRMDVMKTDLLIKLVADFYDDKEIEEAKKLLFQHLSSQRNVKRKGENKKDMNLKDILEILHSLEVPNELQTSDQNSDSLIFATANCMFPSIDVKNIDAGSIMTDIISLKKDVQQMKQEKVENKKLSEQITEIRSMLSELSALTKKKNASKSWKEDNVAPNFEPPQKSSVELDMNQMKPGPSWHFQGCNEDSKANNKPSYSDQVKKSNFPGKQKSKSMDCTEEEENNKNWQLVKKRKKPQLGKLSGSSLKIAPRRLLPADLFISRLSPETSERDLNDFVKLQFSHATDIVCTKLKTRFDTYSSFRITMTGISFKDSLNPENWPDGVLIKRFFLPSENELKKAVETEKTEVKIIE